MIETCPKCFGTSNGSNAYPKPNFDKDTLTHLVFKRRIGPVLEELPQHCDVSALGRDVQPCPAVLHRQVGVRPGLEVKIVSVKF